MSHAEIDVTAILVNYNTRDLLEPCVTALRAGSAGLRLQVVIVDNGSRDGSADLLRSTFTDCEVIVNSANVGFGRANNQALALARGRYVLLLNTDAFVARDGVTSTVRYADEHPACALIGVRLVGRDGVLQPSCRYFPTPWNEFVARAGLSRLFPRTRLVDDMTWDHASPRECDWVPGCYYLVRRSVIDQVGLFDPRFFLYYEEVDHCRAVKAAGWQVVYYPHTTVVHIGGESAKSDAELTSSGRQISALQIESSLLYYRKHHGRLGLWLNVGLTALGDALLTLKCLWRQRTLRCARPYWTHSATTWSLLRKTGWALRPTR
jgi:N-acetylglucosaminyl-diphospho-decaprenol L-rhamnosyltransferase